MGQAARLAIGFLFGSTLFASGGLLRYFERDTIPWAVKAGLDPDRYFHALSVLAPALLYAGLLTQCGMVLAWVILDGRSGRR